MSKTIKIGLFGLGTVGRSVLAMLQRERKRISKRTALDFQIAFVCDRSWHRKKDLLGKIPASANPKDILKDSSIAMVIELIGGAEEACDIWEGAFQAHKPVVSANKALIALHGNRLLQMAYDRGLDLGFEAAVGGAVPLIQKLRRTFAADEIHGLYGILNGTSNFILSQMEKDKIDYAEALQIAKSKGYMEADPSFDIKGRDAAQKLSILAALAFDLPIIEEKSISKKGIDRISLRDIDFASFLGYRICPLAIAHYQAHEHRLELGVEPAMLPSTHVLASVRNAMNALCIESKYAGNSIFIGPGAGGEATALSVISDLVFIARNQDKEPERWLTKQAQNTQTLSTKGTSSSRFYLRLRARDKTGVLAQISRIMADYHISIASMRQYEGAASVDIVILTHNSSEKEIHALIRKMDTLSSLEAPTVSIRMEE